MKDVFCSLGSNLGDREHWLNSAVAALHDHPVYAIERAPIYETAPVGMVDQPSFLNTAVGFKTALDPQQLLSLILDIERDLGRKRRIKWGPRTIDIDIIFYGKEIIETEKLTVPHPRFAERKFVLVPLSDLIPNFIPPGFSLPVNKILQNCGDDSAIQKYETGNRPE
ncbi:MAG: 2-amino-4-hydroxy-6-hydroxymethyldihydropteridine diphosphokinase [Calditrichaeota bacterium]|nr:MAG: 2-amino-4-hydroxy-6-hydroxymethyldihydropteridine diphosphokinase [Calditrichota bacterium]